MIKTTNGVECEYKYEDIILEAQEFLEGADKLLWGWTEKVFSHPLTFPALVSYSFSCELFIKGILQKYNNNFLYIHDLEKLFNSLPQHIISAIKTNINDSNFLTKLKSVALMFEESRYFFDSKYSGKIPDIDFISRLAHCLNEISTNELKITFK